MKRGGWTEVRETRHQTDRPKKLEWTPPTPPAPKIEKTAPAPLLPNIEKPTPAPLIRPPVQSKKAVSDLLSGPIAEGKRQAQMTLEETRAEIDEVRHVFASLPSRVRGKLLRMWSSMNKPVILPGNARRRGKPQTKMRLFVVDTIRFGGTFAGIFIVLFVGINYQSFWQIARAQLALGADVKTEQALEQMVRGNPTTAPGSGPIVRSVDQSLLSFLPPVGPYENRLVIPKLEESVPIVQPSMEALMREDWQTFEEDIQRALHDGVVHYPGSARAGQPGNFFLTGHSSYYPWDDGHYKNVFARLNELKAGDTYSVFFGGDRHTYRITGKKEVSPNDVSVLDQPTDKRMATLMTCTPIGTTLRRLIVTAEEIDPQSGEVLKVGERTAEQQKPSPIKRLEALPI
jgi:LPXTG-site transpeptidase (sortase) family protein